MKKEKALKPLPGAKEERSALIEKLNPLVKLTQQGKGETVRVVLDLPKEWIVLAAWLEVKGQLRDEGNFGDAGEFWRDTKLEPVQKRYAKTYLRRMTNNAMHANLHHLSVGGHWTSYPPEKRKPPAKRAASGTLPKFEPSEIDDDIPF